MTEYATIGGITLLGYLWGKRIMPPGIDKHEEDVRRHIFNESGVQHSQFWLHSERTQLNAKPQQGINTYYVSMHNGEGTDYFKTQYLQSRLSEKPRARDEELPSKSLYFMGQSHPGANPNRNPFNYRN